MRRQGHLHGIARHVDRHGKWVKRHAIRCVPCVSSHKGRSPELSASHTLGERPAVQRKGHGHGSVRMRVDTHDGEHGTVRIRECNHIDHRRLFDGWSTAAHKAPGRLGSSTWRSLPVARTEREYTPNGVPGPPARHGRCRSGCVAGCLDGKGRPQCCAMPWPSERTIMQTGNANRSARHRACAMRSARSAAASIHLPCRICAARCEPLQIRRATIAG